MIGSPPVANNLSRIEFNGIDESEFIDLLKDSPYEKGEAYGFAIEEVEPSLISAYLLLTRPEIRQIYNEDTQSVEEREIQTVEKIPFRVDTKFGVLEVFADQDSVSNVTNKLGQLTNWETTIETASFKPKDVLRSIEENYQAELTSIKIANYPIDDSAVGSFSLQVEDQDIGRNLVEKHTEDIAYLGTEIKIEEDSMTLGIYDSGSVVIYNDANGLDAVLDHIKGSVIRGEK